MQYVAVPRVPPGRLACAFYILKKDILPTPNTPRAPGQAHFNKTEFLNTNAAQQNSKL